MASSTAATTGPDPLFDMKNAFYLGNWQQCLKEAQKVKTTTDEQQSQRDVFMYRAYIAQGKYGLVISEIVDSSSNELQVVKLLARYLQANTASVKSEIVELLDTSPSAYMNDPISSLVAGTIYYLEDNLDSALKLLHTSTDIECMALVVQIYLRLNRLDLARKEHKRMTNIDEYCTLSQLALAWINLFQAGEKLQEAYFIFQELKEKYGATPLLLNGQVCCLIAQARYTEAETLVQEVLDRDSNYTEAIINQMVLAQFAGKPTEVVQRYLNQLKDDSTTVSNSGAVVFCAEFAAKEREFDKISEQYV